MVAVAMENAPENSPVLTINVLVHVRWMELVVQMLFAVPFPTLLNAFVRMASKEIQLRLKDVFVLHNIVLPVKTAKVQVTFVLEECAFYHATRLYPVLGEKDAKIIFV